MLPCDSSNEIEAFSWFLVAKSSLSNSSLTASLDAYTSVIGITWDVGSPVVPADASSKSIAFIALEADGSAWTIVLVSISTNFIAEGSSLFPATRARVADLWSYNIRVLPANTVNIA